MHVCKSTFWLIANVNMCTFAFNIGSQLGASHPHRFVLYVLVYNIESTYDESLLHQNASVSSDKCAHEHSHCVIWWGPDSPIVCACNCVRVRSGANGACTQILLWRTHHWRAFAFTYSKTYTRSDARAAGYRFLLDSEVHVSLRVFVFLYPAAHVSLRV